MTIDPLQSDGAEARLLSRENLVRLVKFGVVGFSGVGVNLAIFELFYRVILVDTPVETRLVIANVAGVVISIFTNFILNDRWTWGDRNKGGKGDWFRRLAKYYLLASVAAGVQVFVTWASFIVFWEPVELVAMEIDLSPTASVLTGIACGMVINFLASHFWAFRDAETT